MPSYPTRCQHIKVNGTQCGSPALRRNRFCYFHKRHHDERVALHLDQLKNGRVKDARRRRRITIDLPVLEDANSIQVSIMQIMRLIIAGQLDGKTAGLLLYALQTASSNLPRTRFEPVLAHDVVLDPRTVDETPLGMHVWEDEDFDDEEDDEEEVGEVDEDEEELEDEDEDEDDEAIVQTAAGKKKEVKPAHSVDSYRVNGSGAASSMPRDQSTG
jgi:hypothetical protein